MSEHRVAVDKRIKRRIVSVDQASLDDSLPTAFLQHIKSLSLVDMYMQQRGDETPLNHSGSLSVSSSSIPQQNEEILNRKYVFWKDTSEPATMAPTPQKANEPLAVSLSPVCQPNTVTQREITFAVVETVKECDYHTEAPPRIPDEENTVILPTLQYCLLTGTKFEGTYYAFLMSHTVPGKKKDTNIGVSRNPIFSVIAHNNQARQNDDPNATVYSFPIIYDKDTASAAPHWRLNTVLGPFFTKHAAENCCHEWVKETRGTVSKENKAPKLARAYGCNLYTSQIPLKVPIERQLVENNAPLQYIRACQSIKHECREVLSNK